MNRWFGFGEARKFLRSSRSPSEQFWPIYHRRRSCMEDIFEQVIFLSPRSVASQLDDFNFPQSASKGLVRFTQFHFIRSRLRGFAALSHPNGACYRDRHGDTAATCQQNSVGGIEEVTIKLRADILKAYCEKYRLVPLWVTDSCRKSERSLGERTSTEHKVFRGKAFCYCQWWCSIQGPAPLRSSSSICGKRLLFPSRLLIGPP
jgi:hypothetical protein